MLLTQLESLFGSPGGGPELSPGPRVGEGAILLMLLLQDCKSHSVMFEIPDVRSLGRAV